MPIDALRQFFKMEAAGGIVLVLASALAIIVANSPLSAYYEMFLNLRGEVSLGPVVVAKPLILWINDGLMAVFFFLVGLEIKRELLEGDLSTISQATLPAFAAAGGMIVPALIYAGLNWGAPENLYGWAIPTATDIAFALGVLALLGSRVPLALKVLLLAIAIFDDLGAIIIIAVFYTEQMSLTSLMWAGGFLVALATINLAGVKKFAPYLILGIALWICVLKSGVHATLAGVALAMAIPMRTADGDSPLKRAEHGLHSWVAFFVLPVFGFANAGVSFAGIGLYNFVDPVKLGISLGLFLGKQVGVFGAIWLAVRVRLVRLPGGVTWQHIYGVAALCGIGFTMSLFIGGLAWEHANFDAPVRLGVITGSIASALVGTLLLLTARKPNAASDKPDNRASDVAPSTDGTPLPEQETVP